MLPSTESGIAHTSNILKGDKTIMHRTDPQQSLKVFFVMDERNNLVTGYQEGEHNEYSKDSK